MNWNKSLRNLFLQIGGKFENKLDKNASKNDLRNNQLNSVYLMLIKKKVYFNQKFSHPHYSSGNSPNTITLSYSVKHLTRIIFFESVLGVSHTPYDKDFAHFGQKKQFKIKMKLKQ